MLRISRHTLTLAVAGAIASMLVAPVAQAQGVRLPGSKQKQEAKRVESDRPAMYPNATRSVASPKASPKLVKQLQALQAAYQEDDNAGVIAKAEEIAGASAAGDYDKAYAYSIAGSAAANMDDQAKAATYFSKAIEANGLDNDSHFTAMYNLAAIQYGNEAYPEALATIDRFLAETKSEDPRHIGFRAGVLGAMERFDEAAVIYKALSAASPDDKRLLMNAVAALQNADKFDEANGLLEDANKRGLLTEQRELRALYVGMMNAERWKDAQAVIEGGQEKGILKPGPELASDYSVLAQQAYLEEENIPRAIELYQRAAPMAADGETYLNLAKVLDYADRKAEAKEAARLAIEKGIKKPEEAKTILAR